MALKKGLAIVLAALLLASAVGRGLAQVKTGDMITPQNADKVRELVSPGVYWAVQHGMSMNIVQPLEFTLPYEI
jgi:hypothetical protein